MRGSRRSAWRWLEVFATRTHRRRRGRVQACMAVASGAAQVLARACARARALSRGTTSCAWRRRDVRAHARCMQCGGRLSACRQHACAACAHAHLRLRCRHRLASALVRGMSRVHQGQEAMLACGLRTCVKKVTPSQISHAMSRRLQHTALPVALAPASPETRMVVLCSDTHGRLVTACERVRNGPVFDIHGFAMGQQQSQLICIALCC